MEELINQQEQHDIFTLYVKLIFAYRSKNPVVPVGCNILHIKSPHSHHHKELSSLFIASFCKQFCGGEFHNTSGGGKLCRCDYNNSNTTFFVHTESSPVQDYSFRSGLCPSGVLLK